MCPFGKTINASDANIYVFTRNSFFFLMPFVWNVWENHKHSLGTENQIWNCPTEYEAEVLATNGPAWIFVTGGR